MHSRERAELGGLSGREHECGDAVEEVLLIGVVAVNRVGSVSSAAPGRVAKTVLVQQLPCQRNDQPAIRLPAYTDNHGIPHQ
ncbi:hypothetical protein [Nocardia sp. NPDC049149]|uniref:hypothetical protein n=1 Tax=Nocardia sp. NPDC049149 TaxID=3364315 RepID=UPI00372394B5